MLHPDRPPSLVQPPSLLILLLLTHNDEKRRALLLLLCSHPSSSHPICCGPAKSHPMSTAARKINPPLYLSSPPLKITHTITFSYTTCLEGQGRGPNPWSSSFTSPFFAAIHLVGVLIHTQSQTKTFLSHTYTHLPTSHSLYSDTQPLTLSSLHAIALPRHPAWPLDPLRGQEKEEAGSRSEESPLFPFKFLNAAERALDCCWLRSSEGGRGAVTTPLEARPPPLDPAMARVCASMEMWWWSWGWGARREGDWVG